MRIKCNTILLMLFLAFFVMNCTITNTVVKESEPPKNLSEIKTMSVGWVDLNENVWYEFAYLTKDYWVKEIDYYNTNTLQNYFKSNFPDKKIIFRKLNEAPGNESDLYVNFKTTLTVNKNYEFFINIIITFQDKEKKDIYNAEIAFYSDTTTSLNWRLSKFIANLVDFISVKIQNKPLVNQKEKLYVDNIKN